MTNEAAGVIIGNIPITGDECYSIPEYQKAKAMAIKALELTGLLKGRPCEVCVNKNEGFCCVWDCPFDRVVKENDD